MFKHVVELTDADDQPVTMTAIGSYVDYPEGVTLEVGASVILKATRAQLDQLAAMIKAAQDNFDN